jgi:hypothetical protein
MTKQRRGLEIENPERRTLLWLMRWNGTTERRIRKLAQRLNIKFDKQGMVSAEDAQRISREHRKFDRPAPPRPEESVSDYNPWVSFTQGGRPYTNRRKH